jgi:hypothetical protein
MDINATTNEIEATSNHCLPATFRRDDVRSQINVKLLDTADRSSYEYICVVIISNK